MYFGAGAKVWDSNLAKETEEDLNPGKEMGNGISECSLGLSGSAVSSAGKQSTCNAGDLGLIPGLGRSSGGGHDKPFQYSCLENPHGQRSLVGHSPWNHKESDTTK